MKIVRTNPILVVLVVLLCALQATLTQRSVIEDHTKFLLPPPQMIEWFTFGFRLSTADSFWLRWIQDGDFCATAGSREQKLPEATEEEKAQPFYNPHVKSCENSWSFQVLDTVTRLDPQFRMAYWAGTMVLAVSVDDYNGASRLFERALKNYPDDWQLTYASAYHELFDMHNLPRAAELANRAADLGAPIWLHALAARIYSTSGQLDLGISTLEAYRRTLKTDEQIARVDERLREMKAKAAAAKHEDRKEP